VLARCVGQLLSSRKLVWKVRVAHADMARRAAENSNQDSITVTCALRKVGGAARQHRVMRKSQHIKMEQGSIRGSRLGQFVNT
ncbi:hypothetical protein A2U01_0068929, partial [Trifolium medium]|nr:hypothetical protein [Trifolium medium]